MKSVKRLREFADELAGGLNADMLRRLVDAIEQEVSDSYMQLPVDADGVPIRVGDVMEWEDGSTDVVVGIDDRFFYYDLDHDGSFMRMVADDVRHHHAPTVEDVLREFAAQVTNGRRIHGAIEIEQAVAECAAKLRLAGDGE